MKIDNCQDSSLKVSGNKFGVVIFASRKKGIVSKEILINGEFY